MRDLKNTTKIEALCKETKEAVFVTKNGYGALVVMDMDLYEELLQQAYEAKLINAALKDVEEGSRLTPTGRDIYDGNSYTAVYPVAYIDLDGVRHAWTDASAGDPALQRLILRSGNIYTFAKDGYNPYLSANLSLTKEIGDHVSLSFFANNFTNARPYRKSWATGVSAIFTPAFYYGLTCRIKL